MKMFSGPGNCRIEPLVKPGRLHTQGFIINKNKHIVPFSALRLMAGKGIAIIGPQGIQAGTFFSMCTFFTNLLWKMI